VTISPVHRFATRKLSTQIFIAQLAILTATVLIGFALFARVERGQLDREYEARAASIAQTAANDPAIQSCLAGRGGPCPESIQTHFCPHARSVTQAASSLTETVAVRLEAVAIFVGRSRKGHWMDEKIVKGRGVHHMFRIL